MVMSRVEELVRSTPGFFRRQAKTLRQARHGWGHRRRVGFVFGCQRSGTKMFMRVLDRVPDTRVYHENHTIAFDDFQLRSDAVIRALISLNPAPVQVFKPICDSHRARAVLDAHPTARGVWLVRQPDAVAHSAITKWGDHQRDVIRALLAGDTERWGWRTADVSDATRATLLQVTDGSVSVEEGALLFWWLRNRFFYAQHLDTDPRVHLAHYEDLATGPSDAFPDALGHLGIGFSPRFVESVRAPAVDRPALAVRPAIRALCDGLYARLRDQAPPVRQPPSPILVFIDTLNMGGAERYAITVANRLAELGIDVTLASSGGDLAHEVAAGVTRAVGPVGLVRTGLPRAALWLRKLMSAGDYKAIVCNSLATTLIARSAQPVRQVPIINVAHGWPEHRFATVAPPMQVADRVVAVSPEVKRKLVAGGLEDARCTVVHNGVDCRQLYRRDGELRHQTRTELGATDPDHVLVLTVGRLEDQKAHHHILAVADRTRTTHPHLRFALVGGGSREDTLRAQAERLGVTDRVRFMGRRYDVPELLGSADLFFNCSDWEGMPLTTIEAMASGLAVVATHTEGADQLLTPTTGIVVPVGDAAEMATALGALCDDPHRRRAAGEAARERALAHFSHPRMVDQLLAVVSSVAR